MAVVIQESSASMTADYSGAKPAIAYATRGGVPMAVLHQTRNAGPIIAGAIRSRKGASAIRIAASVNVVAPRVADIESRYQFHLLQLAWKPVDYALYAGKTAADGSMRLDFVAPPFYPAGSPFLLDADEAGAPPFPDVEDGAARIRPAAVPGMWTVSLESYDHPNADRPLALPNFATASARGGDDKTNYLYEVGRSLYFFSALVVSDLDSGDRKPLGVLNWKSVLLARIRWRDDGTDPVASPATFVRSYFTSEGYFAGAPTDAARRLIVDPPDDPTQTYNAVEAADFRSVIGSTSNSQSVQASKTWTSAVPATHFAP